MKIGPSLVKYHHSSERWMNMGCLEDEVCPDQRDASKMRGNMPMSEMCQDGERDAQISHLARIPGKREYGSLLD